MGIYVNPEDRTKEEWLFDNGVLYTEIDWSMVSHVEPAVLPVVLVNNGGFSAAAVAYSERELEAFKDPDDLRPKLFYLVAVEDLLPVADGLAGIYH